MHLHCDAQLRLRHPDDVRRQIGNLDGPPALIGLLRGGSDTLSTRSCFAVHPASLRRQHIPQKYPLEIPFLASIVAVILTTAGSEERGSNAEEMGCCLLRRMARGVTPVTVADVHTSVQQKAGLGLDIHPEVTTACTSWQARKVYCNEAATLHQAHSGHVSIRCRVAFPPIHRHERSDLQYWHASFLASRSHSAAVPNTVLKHSAQVGPGGNLHMCRSIRPMLVGTKTDES